MFRLKVVSGSGEAFEREYDCASLTIGRSQRAGLTLPDRFLSREHCRITRRGADFVVEDLGSRNGTYLNEARIAGPVPFSPGDTIRISESELSLELCDGVPGSCGDADREDHAAFVAGASLLIPAAELAAARLAPRPEGIEYYVESLRLLDDVHRSLANSVSLEDLLELILERLFEHLAPEEGVVILEQEGSYERVAERRAPGVVQDYMYSRTLIEEVAGKRQGAVVLDAQADERFADAESILASGVRSIVAAPLIADDESLGLIAMSSRIKVREFSRHDLELLSSLASVAALRLKNISHAAEAADRRKLEAEITLARSIQEALMPTRVPHVPGYDLTGLNLPSQGVSGDLYQVVAADSGSDYFLFLFDVSGKGLAASLLAATIESLAATQLAGNLPPDRICARINDQLDRRTLPDRFATAFLARLDVRRGVLTYANAGHNPALLLRATGETERLARTGLPLAVLPGSSYAAREIVLGGGDLLVIYSDGLTEARNLEGEEYGLERLERVCVAALGMETAAVVQRIEASVRSFAAGRPYDDDQTLLAVRRRVARS